MGPGRLRGLPHRRPALHREALARPGGEESPSPERLRYVWDRVAFTNYVGESVGTGPRVRPTDAMWATAHGLFPDLLERLRPHRVVVLGRELWKEMPPTQICFTDAVQAYRLADGALVHCWPTYHPSRGLSWRELAAIIQFACGSSLSGQ